MIELRFIERKLKHGPHKGSLRRVLQSRHGACYPWVDVPLVTLEAMEQEKREAASDLTVKEYK